MSQRTAVRHALTLRAEIFRGGHMVLSETINLSARGAFVQTDAPFTVGDTLSMRVSLPNHLTPRTLQAEVRWVRPGSEDEAAGIGLKWTPDGIDSETRELLESLVPETAEPPKGRTHRILIVDDNRHVQEILRSGLRRLEDGPNPARIDITEAKNGEEAWAAIQAEVPDLVILDLYMPVLNGDELLSRVRANDASSKLPVLVVSAGGLDAREQALAAGADLYLDKPIRLFDLLYTVRSLLKLPEPTGVF